MVRNRTGRAAFCLKEGGEQRLSNGPYTVLVVEDEPWIRIALVQHLESCNFRVREAASMSEAIRVLEQPGVDLVFTDLRLLGDGDGLLLARWVTKHHPDIPVMLTSGEIGQMKGLAELCRAEGFISLAKPYAHGEVSARILELIKARPETGAR